MKKLLLFAVYTIFFGIVCNFLYKEYEQIKMDELANSGGVSYAISNYRKNVDSLAAVFKLPPDYLLAVIMLESSGRKNVPTRYEDEIYKQLKLLQEGKIEKFENMKPSDLKGVKDKTLKAMATSYGPFQIMGYKKYILNVPLDSITGKNNIYYAIKWIDLSYGSMLRESEFKDAFHFHNTGKKFPEDGKPLTHDPKYVENGLNFQNYFLKTIYKKNASVN